VVRIDTGGYVPFYLNQGVNVPVRAIISLPFHLWAQLTDKLWLGPLLGVRLFDCPDRFYSDCGNRVSLPLGFGLGYQISRELDLKTQMIFQDVTRSTNPPVGETGPRATTPYWGLGAGIEVRVE
jgi:hypothetical protein